MTTCCVFTKLPSKLWNTAFEHLRKKFQGTDHKGGNNYPDNDIASHLSLENSYIVTQSPRNRLRVSLPRPPVTTAGLSAARTVFGAKPPGSMSTGGLRHAHVTVAYADLDTGIQKLERLPAPRYIVFTADPDPATGLAWCPDCVRALPAVRRTMEDRGASLLEVGVGQRADWKGNASHPCRVDPRFLVGGVPTLVHWKGAGEAGEKLGSELEAASSPQEAVALVAKFIIDTTEQAS